MAAKTHSSFRLSPVARVLLLRIAERQIDTTTHVLELAIRKDAKSQKVPIPTTEEAERELRARAAKKKRAH